MQDFGEVGAIQSDRSQELMPYDQDVGGQVTDGFDDGQIIDQELFESNIAVAEDPNINDKQNFEEQGAMNQEIQMMT